MTTLNLQVDTDADDGFSTSADDFYPGLTTCYIGEFSTTVYSSWFRFTGVSGLSGAMIGTASYQLKGGSGSTVGPTDTKVFAEESATPVAPTDADDHQAKTRTTAGVDWDWTPVDGDWANKDITAVIQELADTYDPSVIQILHDDDGSTNEYAKVRAHEEAAADAAKLDIDYTRYPVIQSRSEQKEPDETTTSTITAPSGIQDGDVLVLCMATDGDMPAASITWPSGFTPIAEVNNGTVCSVNVAYKIAASESGNYTVSWTASEQAILQMYRIDGAVSGSEIQDPNESNTGTTSPATIIPVASTDTNNSLVIVVMGMDDDDITEDAGGDADYTTEDVDRSTTGNGTCSIGVQSKTIAAAAVPPQCDLTLTGDEQFAAVWFAVRSVAPPTVGQPTMVRTQGVPTGPGAHDRAGRWN